ncbi:hypothetical protein FLONG3_141 [Fusarium longipes]|uniref:Uncharacterized protein n=1 Tax=Fusarium longipes TaxID=694270 RepID=A0A395TB52_9HYPO|nr:hypothetical protein FLONG3_141 [Fusarium longipes]
MKPHFIALTGLLFGPLCAAENQYIKVDDVANPNFASIPNLVCLFIFLVLGLALIRRTMSPEKDQLTPSPSQSGSLSDSVISLDQVAGAPNTPRHVEAKKKLTKSMARGWGNWSGHHPRHRLLDALYGYSRYYERQKSELNRLEGLYKHVSKAQKSLLEHSVQYSKKFNRIDGLLRKNQELCNSIVQNAMKFYDISQDELDRHIKDLEASGKLADKISVSQSLKHYVRDWTETGEAERKSTFSCLINTLEGLFPERHGDRPVKVLVPGSGLGRLGHDIARLGGFDVTINEWSMYMNVAYRFLEANRPRNSHSFHPFIDNWSHHAIQSNMVRPLSFPDVSLNSTSVVLIEGDFTTVFPTAGEYDVVVTYFFIDTARNLMSYLDTIKKVLKPGGHWINLGPLLYGTGPFVQLSLEEILIVSEALGFEFLETDESCGEKTFDDRTVRGMEAAHDSNAVEASKPAFQQPSQAKLFTLDEMIRRRAAELGDTILMGAPEKGVDDFKEHSAIDLDRYVDAAVARFQAMGLKSVVCTSSNLQKMTLTIQDPTLEKAPVVGMLGQSGIHVVVQIVALNRLGYSAFLISTRLASPAITQLLDLASCNIILSTPNFHPVLKEVQENRQLEILPMLQSADVYHHDAPHFMRDYNPEAESRKVAVIIHSSGSTGLPKPIYLTNSSCIGAFAVHMNMRGFLTSPFFHSHGFYEVFRSIYSGKQIYLTNYGLPITRESVIAQLKAVKPEIFHCVPYVIKLLAESEEGIRILADMKVVLYAGSGCPDDLGDRLVERGVNLCGNYGATETGRLATSQRPEGDKAWNYIRVLPPAEPYTVFDEVAPGLFECVALDGLPSKSTTNSDNPPGSFRTRDLFTQHPTRPTLWKFACRLDDRFTLINGEKVLPIPIEGRIRQEEIVKEAIVFGDGRTYPGILIVKADRAADMPDDEYLDAIWPSVEDANSRAESFSRIPKELVVIVPADVSYPRTDKGTFIRVPTYRQFQKEIEAAYSRYEGQDDQAGSLTIEGKELEDYLLEQLKSKCGVELESSKADFFASGVDSLQCIQMWSLIKREIDLGGNQSELGQNVLYETGNVKLLARQLERIRSGSGDETEDQLKIMENLVEKYSSFRPHVAGSAPQPEKELVLLTGVTGALGAHTLAQLTAQPHVGAVWALIRASSDHVATDRLYKSLETRGLSLDEEQKGKVLALPCDLSRPDLGLSESHLSELQNKLTTIIHSAWAVNFNISVQSFEDQHIKAVHNLIQLSLSVQTPKPARFFFCSSVSSAGGTPRPGQVLETLVPSPAHAQHTGYARSKYVAEHITGNASKAGAVARVLRLGQLVGDTKVGEWNTTEGIPLMIQTAVTLGALPALNEEMTWLPVDLAASAILDLSNLTTTPTTDRSSSPDLVYHILNPIRFHWTNQMLPAMTAAGFKFETLPTSEWMQRLRDSDRDPSKNPPIKLLDWFESKYGNKASTKAETGPLDYLTDLSREDSVTLRNVPDVTNVGYVNMVLGRLQKHWEEGTT